ncbi:MAG: 50S ribosomal protein L29 [Chloroflexota bacterium]|jgi:large subunit ribosomal protein L29|nr:50S ribosomal protein L29 [Anaerolineae bacterium]
MARKTANIRSMTAGELAQALDDAKEELFNLRFQWESGQLEDYTRIRQLKKDVARYLTVQRERELAAQIVQEERDDE